MKHYVILAAATLIAVPLSADKQADPLPDWMAGVWETGQAGRWVDEYWTPARGGTMLGGSRTGNGPVLQTYELLRIARKPDGGVSYFAMPMGAPATEFAMTKSGPNMVEFTNPAHDFPQRIRYTRNGRSLTAEVSLLNGSNAQRWNYRLVGPGR